jgi:hypothetical protein
MVNGYRQSMQMMYGFSVSREAVGIILKVLDPSGVETRSRRCLRRREYRGRGPNFIWYMHARGYDKNPTDLRFISIDCHSRRILWLQVFSTNQDPKYVARYFLDCIRQLDCVSRLVRADRGSEIVNAVCAFRDS